VRDAAVLLRNNAEVGEGHRIETDVPSDEVWFEADEGQIRQIVWNLASNGLRAMPDGGRLRLVVRRETLPGAEAGAAESDVVLEIQDEGVGMAPDDLDNIFQPFHGTFAKGSGLGMAIVHRIVSDYGGEVQVTSKPAAGTTVRVRLPARATVAI